MILAASDVLSRGRDFDIFFSLCWQWDGWDFNADECALSELSHRLVTNTSEDSKVEIGFGDVR